MPSKLMAPGPGWVQISSVPFMLAEEFDGNGEPAGFQWSQEEMKYSPPAATPQAEPYTLQRNFEVPQTFRGWTAGAGFRTQSESSTPTEDILGYYEGHFIDKYGMYMGNAAAPTAVTPTETDAVNGGNQFIEFTVGGTRKLVCAMGRYVKVRDGDTAGGWVTAKDLGSGNKITGMAVFRGAQSSDFLFIAYQNSSGVAQTYQVWDGTSNTSTFSASTSVGLAPKGVDFRRWRDRIWVLYQDANGRWSQASSQDGGVAATWLNGGYIEDSTTTCRFMVTALDHLLTQSTLGPLDRADDVVVIAKALMGDTFRDQYLAMNSCRPVVFGTSTVIFWTANSWYRLDLVTGQTEEIGPGTMKSNDSVVNGLVTAAAAYRDWTVYYAMYNANNTTAYLMRWGDWDYVQTNESRSERRDFVPAHIGSIYEQTSQINGMGITDIPGTPRLYYVDAAGVITYLPLPRFNTNAPADTGSVTFNTTNPFQLFLPGITAHNGVVDKVNLGIALSGKNLSGSSRYITASYRLDATSAFGGSSNLQNSGVFSQDPGQRNNFVTSVKSQWTDVKLVGTTTSSATPTLLESVEMYQAFQPPFKWVWSGVLKLGDQVPNRAGMTNQKTLPLKDQISFLETLGTSGVISLVTPEGNTYDVLMTACGPSRGIERDAQGRTFINMPIQLMQHRSTSQAGTNDRLSTQTNDQLAQYTNTQLLGF